MQVTWPLTPLTKGSHKLTVIERSLGTNFITSLDNVTKNMKFFFRNEDLRGIKDGVKEIGNLTIFTIVLKRNRLNYRQHIFSLLKIYNYRFWLEIKELFTKSLILPRVYIF